MTLARLVQQARQSSSVTKPVVESVARAKEATTRARERAADLSQRARWFVAALRDEYPKRGFWGTVDAIKAGHLGLYDRCFVAEDELGNRYYENRHDAYMRDRWCEYRDTRNADPINVPSEWHAWLHHLIDDPPVGAPSKWRRPTFQKPPHRNLSGTPFAYAPRNSPRSPEYVGHLAESRVKPWEPTAATAAPRHRPRALVRNGEPGVAEDPRLDIP
ncbi:hypothetical protein CDCA_CDCA10G3039 [Cyanidium caldarium]|uniref:NADH dehydrogenase [ubiquinone] 1 alpha subcomplex subunit 12 n=1 Tax=Cyanidium caldarium TaxID=2771 RepID=A0AAV9IXM6_CYACA|nr:hypothetical protein CDCA_CDCA10G3039 [Cyanidium caldarium]